MLFYIFFIIFFSNQIFCQMIYKDLFEAISKNNLVAVQNLLPDASLSQYEKKDLHEKSKLAISDAEKLCNCNIENDWRLWSATIATSGILSFGSEVAIIMPTKWYKNLENKQAFGFGLIYNLVLGSAISYGLFKMHELLQKNKRQKNLQNAKQIEEIFKNLI